MTNIPDHLKYTASHEWIRIEGDTAVIGITDHAQVELTDIVYVELPEVGRTLAAGEGCGVVESVKTASDCLLYTSPSPRDKRQSRMPSSA